MKFIETRALRGPNRYSLRKSIFMLLDIGANAKLSNAYPGFADRLLKLMPMIAEHKTPSGLDFAQELEKGVSMAQLVEHITWELQELAGLEVKFS